MGSGSSRQRVFASLGDGPLPRIEEHTWEIFYAATLGLLRSRGTNRVRLLEVAATWDVSGERKNLPSEIYRQCDRLGLSLECLSDLSCVAISRLTDSEAAAVAQTIFEVFRGLDQLRWRRLTSLPINGQAASNA